MNAFERYLSLWVGLCMVVGVAIGTLAPALMRGLRGLEFGSGSQINVPIAVLIWLMITPMMMKVDFGAIRNVGRRPRGLLVTLFVNWMVKPFSMAAIAWLFFRYVFGPWIPPADADQYIAGCIILAAAPCTAMVFVWSYLSDGDPAYTLVQVSVNDLLMLLLFAPIVRYLVSGASSLQVPFEVLLYSVLVFIVIPLAAGVLLRQWFLRAKGRAWFENVLLPRFAPVSMTALLATLVLIFAFQAENITTKTLHVALIAVPILIQVYFNSSLDLRVDAAVPCRVRDRRARRPHRREQFLRARRGDGDCALRPRVRRRARHRGRRSHRGAGHAVGLLRLQSDAALVSHGAGSRLTRSARLTTGPARISGTGLPCP